MARFIERSLNDATLGFLALLSLFLMVAPSVFELSDVGMRALFVVEYAIISLFALEYGAAWFQANDKLRFALDRWRIIDALIIVAPMIALLPVGPDLLRSSPVLRLLRLGRLALLGTRSGIGLRAPPAEFRATASGPASELAVFALAESGTEFASIPWESCLNRIGNAEPDWLFISGVTEDRLAPIAAALGVPEKAVQGLFQSSVPRFDRLERFSTLFVRYPLPPLADGRLRRTPVLLVGTADNVVVLSREQSDLVRRVEQRLGNLDAATPRMVRAMVALVGEILRAYTQVVERLETSLLLIEVDQAKLRDEGFLTRTFELRADILRVRSSLKHLKSVARDLSHGQLSVATTDAGDWSSFRLLADDAGDLYGSIEDLRDSLQALVDLRLNVSSFQMNRVMRLLALLTALALIPATAGGLLGMNLQDTPWPATLAQVSFGVAAGMALSLYVFAIKGWLR
jgi:Mg2+ and Co2+ transporter CorA